jgi:hypothetical protein
MRCVFNKKRWGQRTLSKVPNDEQYFPFAQFLVAKRSLSGENLEINLQIAHYHK